MTKLLLTAIVLLIITACAMAVKKKKPGAVNACPAVKEHAGALYPVAQKNKWGYMDHTFKIVIPFQFEQAEDFSEGLAAVASLAKGTDGAETLLYGCIDSTGKTVIDYRYNKIYPFSEGLSLVVKDGKYGYIDRTGAEIIPPQYEDGSSFSEGLATVKINGRNGFINKTGDMVAEPRYERACWVSIFREGLAAVYTDDESGGYADSTGELVIPARFSYVSAFSEGLALVQPKGSSLYGYINRKGEMVIKPEFELSLPFHEGVASVKKRKTDGSTFFRIINKEGKALSPDLHYNFVGIFREGLAGVESSGHRWGFIDRKGREVITPQYAGIRLFNHGLSMIQTGHLFTRLNTSYIDKEGNIVFDGRD